MLTKRKITLLSIKSKSTNTWNQFATVNDLDRLRLISDLTHEKQAWVIANKNQINYQLHYFEMKQKKLNILHFKIIKIIIFYILIIFILIILK